MKKRVLVRYKVKPDRVAENEALVRQVFEQLERDHPENLRYATFRFPDGVTFAHIVSLEGEDNSHPLADLESFKAFTARIRERCEEPPLAVELSVIGSYRFFQD
jgi:hypothetical protein